MFLHGDSLVWTLWMCTRAVFTTNPSSPTLDGASSPTRNLKSPVISVTAVVSAGYVVLQVMKCPVNVAHYSCRTMCDGGAKISMRSWWPCTGICDGHGVALPHTRQGPPEGDSGSAVMASRCDRRWSRCRWPTKTSQQEVCARLACKA